MTADQIPIGIFSRITHLSQKALRLYDEKGLLVPAEKDLCTGYRYYTCDQIERGIWIRNLLWLGFSLQEARDLLDAKCRGDVESIRGLFEKRLSETEEEARRLHAVQEILRTQDPLTGGFCMSVTEPIIKEVPALRVISRRERGVYQETIPRLIMELCGCFESDRAQRSTARVTGPVMFICHDEEYRETDADIEVALPITGRISVEKPEIEVRNLPGGMFVSVVYTGPYPGVGKAYERLFAYMGQHNLIPAGPSRELYINDPREVPEHEVMTEVQCPVRKED